MIRERKLEPFYVFNDSEARKINLFYKKDKNVEGYLEKLNGYSGLRKK